MWTERGGITGVGYEGRTIEELVGELQSLRVSVLVDVRLNAISRKRGFSKRALSEVLAEAGIAYLHRPQLGNPRDNRPGYSEDWNSDVGRTARNHFAETAIDTEGGRDAVGELADLADDERVALLCFEASELHCHRREVLGAVRERLAQMVSAS